LILSVVDAISEGAEVVDCFYKQLPKATRDRWARKAADYVGEEFTSARAVESARVVDRPKAYGIQGADWKASALWHNWEQLGNVEINAALECVVVNHISDKFIGAAIGAKNKLTRQRNQIRALRGGGKRRWGARHTKGR
jgi:phage tail sheath protein FI